MTQAKTTPFYEAHLAAGGKMVEFAGSLLPIHYGSQIREHEAVRTDAGMFDVSHMLVSDVSGSGAYDWLRRLLANDVRKLATVGKALYTPMLNEAGGVIDDLIVYRMNEENTQFRIVSNAATRDKDLAQFVRVAGDADVQITPRDDVSMLAVQGPRALERLFAAFPAWQDMVNALGVFQGAFVAADVFVAKTGYTGEAGVEIISPAKDARVLFETLQAAGVVPCGLGARDTLRMEAGMNLYGHDMDEAISPLEAGMAWTIDWKDESRDFVGKSALAAQRAAGVPFKQTGLLLEGRGVLREGMSVQTDAGEGIITSGTFSPTLKQSIAIARIPTGATGNVTVDLRGTQTPLRIIPLPFVRNGKKQFD